jgi:hypothetical protein
VKDNRKQQDKIEGCPLIKPALYMASHMWPQRLYQRLAGTSMWHVCRNNMLFLKQKFCAMRITSLKHQNE